MQGPNIEVDTVVMFESMLCFAWNRRDSQMRQDGINSS